MIIRWLQERRRRKEEAEEAAARARAKQVAERKRLLAEYERDYEAYQSRLDELWATALAFAEKGDGAVSLAYAKLAERHELVKKPEYPYALMVSSFSDL